MPNLLDQSDVWTLRTIYGDVDLLYAPAGGGYNHLLANAELVTVRGYPVLVASLDDIIHSKELANRDKDHMAPARTSSFPRRTEKSPGKPWAVLRPLVPPGERNGSGRDPFVRGGHSAIWALSVRCGKPCDCVGCALLAGSGIWEG